jgi:hypothetical protein
VEFEAEGLLDVIESKTLNYYLVLTCSDRLDQPALGAAERQDGPQTHLYDPQHSTTAQPRPAANARIRPNAAGPGQDQPLAAYQQARGYFRRWWQVFGFEPT